MATIKLERTGLVTVSAQINGQPLGRPANLMVEAAQLQSLFLISPSPLQTRAGVLSVLYQQLLSVAGRLAKGHKTASACPLFKDALRSKQQLYSQAFFSALLFQKGLQQKTPRS
jgi:hypothetical protein